MTYKIRFIDNVMASCLEHLTDNLAEGLHKDKCKDCKSNLEYMTANDGLLIFMCVDCNKTYEKKFDEDLFKRFQNNHTLCDRDLNKFSLMLQKGFYPFEYIDG